MARVSIMLRYELFVYANTRRKDGGGLYSFLNLIRASAISKYLLFLHYIVHQE